MRVNPLLRDTALLPLPEVGFRALARSSDAAAALVAGNPACPEALLGELAASGPFPARRTALSRTGDVSLLTLENGAKAGPGAGIAANPLTPPGVLADLVTSGADSVVQAAFSNPSTPAAALLRRARGVPALSILGRSVSNNSLRGARAGRAVAFHPALQALWASDPEPAVRRAVARQPGLDPAVAARVAAAPGRGGMLELALNPSVDASLVAGARARGLLEGFLAGRDVDALLKDPAARLELASFGSPTFDLLLARSGCSVSEATRLLERCSRSSHPAQPSMPMPEADALALALEPHGAGLALSAYDMMAGSRVAGVCAVSPLLRSFLATERLRTGRDWDALARAVASRLGEDPLRWELFVGLAADWVSSDEALLEAAALL